MRDDVFGADPVGRHQVLGQREDGIDLWLGVRVDIAVVVDDLDADGGLIQALEFTPGAFTGVKGGQRVWAHPEDAGLGLFIADQVVDTHHMTFGPALETIQGGG